MAKWICSGTVERDGKVREATFTREITDEVPVVMRDRVEGQPETETVVVRIEQRVIENPGFAADIGQEYELD